ncbi:hypothetical protein ACFXNW_18295 [Nocardia sp. NPDC059180]|uniref:hypothetical protein n=1 Tax=Nocardia sp. NPDC059180 TaxID=3346761 RepID=UPI0036784660
MQRAIDGFFERMVDSALNPLLELLSGTLLTTPEPDELPRSGELWSQSWQLVLAMYGLLVMAVGVLLMLYEVAQTRWGVRELLPRMVVGFIAGAMSMTIAGMAIRFANALALALAGEGVEPDSAGVALRELASVGGGAPAVLFNLLLRTALVIAVTVLLIVYVIRVAITVVLIVAAPLALMCHALPGVDGIARWWWRAFAACLAIQIVQSLLLITILRVFLTPGGWGLFGANRDGAVSLLVALAVMVLLIKVPFWLLSSLKLNSGRSFTATVVKSYLAYKTFGLLRSGEKAVGSALRPPPPQRPRGPALPRTTGRTAGGPTTPDPYARVRATRDGQLMLPLDGVHRTRRSPSPQPPPQQQAPAPAPARRRSPAGRQLAFDFTPPDPYKGTRARRDGQYQLPIPVQRVPRAAQPAPDPVSPTRRRGLRGRQLAFDFDPPDPYARVRVGRDGQYQLPIPVQRVPRAARPAPPPPLPPPVEPPRGRQLHLPLPNLPVPRRNRRTPGGGSR